MVSLFFVESYHFVYTISMKIVGLSTNRIKHVRRKSEFDPRLSKLFKMSESNGNTSDAILPGPITEAAKVLTDKIQESTPNRQRNDTTDDELTIIKNGLSPKFSRNLTTSRENAGDQTSASYQSAYDTIQEDPAVVSKKSEYELATQENESITQSSLPTAHLSYSSLNVDGSEVNRASIPTGFTSCVLSNVYRLWQYMREKLKQQRRQEPEDLERQPLLRPEDPVPVEPITEDRYCPCIDNYHLLLIATFVIAGALVATVLITGDTKLLVKMAQYLLCDLLGPTLSEKLFGKDFCPVFDAH